MTPKVLVCTQAGPKAPASRSPVHLAGGAGGFQRNSPTGGAAKGMPRNALMPFAAEPFNDPSLIFATSGLPDLILLNRSSAFAEVAQDSASVINAALPNHLILDPSNRYGCRLCPSPRRPPRCEWISVATPHERNLLRARSGLTGELTA